MNTEYSTYEYNRQRQDKNIILVFSMRKCSVIYLENSKLSNFY